jgi:hypothetical protein
VQSDSKTPSPFVKATGSPPHSPTSHAYSRNLKQTSMSRSPIGSPSSPSSPPKTKRAGLTKPKNSELQKPPSRVRVSDPELSPQELEGEAEFIKAACKIRTEFESSRRFVVDSTRALSVHGMPQLESLALLLS